MTTPERNDMRWKTYWLCDPRLGMRNRPLWWRWLKWIPLSHGWLVQRLPNLVARIKGYGAVDTIVDVGVCYGTPALWLTNPKADLVLVDPGVCSSPNNRPATVLRAAAGDKNGTVSFEISDYAPGSRTGVGEPVKMTRVDSLNLRGRIGLKIDVEGNEMAVLHGCETIMPRVQWAIVEWHLHGGDCLPSEMVAWFAEHGMQLHDTLHGINPDAPHVGAMDVVFRKANAEHHARPERSERT